MDQTYQMGLLATEPTTARQPNADARWSVDGGEIRRDGDFGTFAAIVGGQSVGEFHSLRNAMEQVKLHGDGGK